MVWKNVFVQYCVSIYSHSRLCAGRIYFVATCPTSVRTINSCSSPLSLFNFQIWKMVSPTAVKNLPTHPTSNIWNTAQHCQTVRQTLHLHLQNSYQYRASVCWHADQNVWYICRICLLRHGRRRWMATVTNWLKRSMCRLLDFCINL